MFLFHFDQNCWENQYLNDASMVRLNDAGNQYLNIASTYIKDTYIYI